MMKKEGEGEDLWRTDMSETTGRLGHSMCTTTVAWTTASMTTSAWRPDARQRLRCAAATVCECGNPERAFPLRFKSLTMRAPSSITLARAASWQRGLQGKVWTLTRTTSTCPDDFQCPLKEWISQDRPRRSQETVSRILEDYLIPTLARREKMSTTKRSRDVRRQSAVTRRVLSPHLAGRPHPRHLARGCTKADAGNFQRGGHGGCHARFAPFAAIHEEIYVRITALPIKDFLRAPPDSLEWAHQSWRRRHEAGRFPTAQARHILLQRLWCQLA